MSHPTETYSYVPAAVTFTGGGTADIIARQVQVQRPSSEVVFFNGSYEIPAGKGGLSFSGPITIDTNIDDVLDRINDSVETIVIGDTTYSGCNCQSATVSTAGSAETAVYLEGALNYTFEAENPFTPITLTIDNEFTDILVQSVQIQEDRDDLTGVDGETVDIARGPGSIRLSGLIKPAAGGTDADSFLDKLTRTGASVTNISIGNQTFSECTCISVALQIPSGADAGNAYVSGTLAYRYEVVNNYTPASFTLSGGETGNMLVQSITMNENIQPVLAINDDPNSPRYTLPANTPTVELSGLIKVLGLYDGGDVIDALTTTDTIYIGGKTLENARCVSSSIRVTGSDPSTVYLSGSLGYTYESGENELEFSDVSISSDDGIVSDMLIQSVQVGDQGRPIRVLTGDGPGDMVTGYGTITLSGIIATGGKSFNTVAENFDLYGVKDEATKVTIRVGDNEYEDCIRTGGTVQVVGRTQATTYLQASLTYRYYRVIDVAPSFSGADTWINASGAREDKTETQDIIIDSTAVRRVEVYSRFKLTATIGSKTQPTSMGNMLSTGSVFDANSSISAVAFTQGGVSTSNYNSISLTDDTTTGERAYRLLAFSAKYHEEGYITYAEKWQGNSQWVLTERYDFELGRGSGA